PPPRPAYIARRWSDVPSRQPDPCAEIIEHGRTMHADVAEATRRARAEGQAGDRDASGPRTTRVPRARRERRRAQHARAAQYRAGVQIERAEINKRGRAVGHLVGRSGCGSALRGGMERGRGRARARLAQEEADVRVEFEKLKLSLDDLVLEVRREIDYIKEARAERRR